MSRLQGASSLAAIKKPNLTAFLIMSKTLNPFSVLIAVILLPSQVVAQCDKPVIIADDAITCNFRTTTLHTKDIPGATYQWSDGQTTPSRQAGPGRYAVTVTIGGCAATSDTIEIKGVTAPLVYADRVPEICAGESITLYADTGNNWRRRADITAPPRFDAVSLILGSKAYMGTGTTNNSTLLKDWWEYDNTSGVWTQKADLPGPARRGAMGFVIDRKAYVGTGGGETSQLNDFYEYDPFNNSWSAKANYPNGKVYGAVGFSIGDKGYAGLGKWDVDPTDTKFWSYDPGTDSWSQVADFPGPGRYLAGRFVLEGKGYVTCGSAAGGLLLNDCWKYDPVTNSWAVQTSLPGGARYVPVSFSIGNRGYIVGGLNSPMIDVWEFRYGAWKQRASYPGAAQVAMGAFGFSDKALLFGGTSLNHEVWEYRPQNEISWVGGSGYYSFTTNKTGHQGLNFQTPEGCDPSFLYLIKSPVLTADITINGNDTICEGDSVKLTAVSGDNWTPKNDFPLSTLYCSGFAIGTTGYFIGGQSTPRSFHKYDQSTDTWTQLPELPMFIISTVAFSWKGKGYVYGYDKAIWMFDPVTEMWTKKAVSPGTQALLVHGFLLNDKIYIAGGIASNGSTVLKEVWEYDLVNDSWTQKNDMPYYVGYGAYFALDGKGYLCTGNSDYGQTSGLNQSDVFLQYDPVSDAWTVLPPFPGGPRGGAIGFSDGYKAYVGLGNQFGMADLTDIWEFDAATLSWTRMTDIPQGRYGTRAFVLGRYAYIGSGASVQSGILKDVWQYELPHHYQWSDGRTGKSIWVKQTGNYGLTITSHGGCSAAATPVEIEVLPATRIVQHPTDTAVCEDASLQFAANATGVDVTYIWQLNGNDLSDGGAYTGTQTDQLSIADASVPGQGVFRLIANGACGADTSTEATLTLYSLPARPVITASGATEFCEGGSVTLTSSASYGNTWSTGANGQDITVSTAGTYTVSVTDNNGCTSPVSDVVTVTVNTNPSRPTISLSGATEFCEGSSVTLTSSAANGNSWSNGATGQAITVSTAGTYTVAVSDNNGCTSPVSDPVTITVHPTPAQPVIMAGGPLEFCAGSSVTLSTDPAAQYQWSDGRSAQAITVNQSGDYTVQITDVNGCTSPASATVTVLVHPLPAGAIITNGPMAAGNTRVVELQAPQLPGASYRWNTGDSTATIRVAQSGYYRVTVTNAAGCAQSFDINVELVDLTKIPNTFSPNRDGINDYWTVPNLHLFPQARVMIFNRNGNKVFEATGGNIRWDGTSNGKELPAGVYYYVLDLRDGGQPVNGWINLMK
jgi:gliding motility-associated-like protein